ncbi:hypothetical protein L6164_005825 [Bauhinia variegata]|uniref:Uncharacterized protein n=1 Tax=Bauhinia variegata TaxID=167791 RepID=A0ACB9PSI3_BAUVA|nr:hypothetical protein L6164_005825 [Bauhinia variegata]
MVAYHMIQCLKVSMQSFTLMRKWFYMTKKGQNYYLLVDEEEPRCTCKCKSFIGKVMFLVVLTHPRFASQGNEVFSRKIDVFQFVTQEPAKRTSVNKIARTLETKAIALVKIDVVRSFFIEKVESPKTIDELVSAVVKSF